MREKAFLFGETKSLVGIVTEPATPVPGRPAVVVLNAGLIHRVGPNRLHVQLARRLAAAGFPVLRFDFSGIGDSKPRTDNRPFLDAAVEETRAAMDFLQSSRGVEQFVLAGICSGADSALRAACGDERVTGAVLIEGFAIALPGFFFYHHRKNLLRVRSWLRLLSGKSETVSQVRAAAAARKSEDEIDIVSYFAQPDREVLLDELRGLRRRDVSMLFLYSTESPAYYSYRRLLHRKLRRTRGAGHVQSEAIDGADHTFTRLSDQRHLLKTVESWAAKSYA